MNTNPYVICFALIYFLSFSTQAQEKWVTDAEMQFKIKIPENYSQKEIRDGSDKVLTVMSPDQNIFIRVRAMKANDQFSVELLQQVFEKNIIQGANRIMNKDGDLNGIPARAAAYTWKVDDDDAVLAVYYIIQNNFAYVVWAAVPKNHAEKYSASADRIIDSFDLATDSSSNIFAGLSKNTQRNTQVSLLDCKMGTQVDQDGRIRVQTSNFKANSEKIHVCFSYSGNTFSNPFSLKWYCRSNNQLVNEFLLNTPNENDGHGYGFISNSGNPWPKGEYSVEIWCDGKILGTSDYLVQ